MLSAIEETNFGSYIEKLAREIWERKALEQGYDPVLIKAYGERLSEGIIKGFGNDYVDIDFDKPDYNLLHSLEKNVWQFSGAKTYTQLKQMSEALYKPDGSLRSFEEFRIQTVIITGKHLRYLKAEYDTAVAGAQMAAKWKTIQEQKEIYPLLQFEAVEDENTTAICLSLNGVIRPVDDVFWLVYYPLNHYRCRSTVRQLRKGTITPTSEIKYPIIPDIFKVNLGQRGLAFPEDHAYFTDTPPEVLEAGRRYYPYNMQFDILDSAGMSGILRQHYMVDTRASDYQRLLEYAIQRAKSEKINVDIMPTLGREQDQAQRLIIFPDAKKAKSPDLRIDQVLWEEEGVKTHSRRAIKGAVEAGANQANNLIIHIPETMKLEFELSKIARDKFKDYEELQTIIFKHGDNEFRFDRKK